MRPVRLVRGGDDHPLDAVAAGTPRAAARCRGCSSRTSRGASGWRSARSSARRGGTRCRPRTRRAHARPVPRRRCRRARRRPAARAHRDSAERAASSRRITVTARRPPSSAADQPAAEQPVGAGDQRRALGQASGGRSVPQLPRRPPCRPQVVEQHRVLVRVHAVPEALVAERAQLAGGGQPRRAARARAPSRSSSTSSTDGSKQKKPPLTQCSLRGFSTNPRTTPSPFSSATPNWSSGRTTVIVAAAGGSVVLGEQRMQVDVRHAVGVRHAERARRRAASAALRTRPPVGVSSPVSRHAHVAPRRPRRPLRRTPRSARPCIRSAARSAGTPAPGRSASRATGSAGRRSPPAAWGSTGCAPAAASRGRRRGSRRWAARSRIIGDRRSAHISGCASTPGGDVRSSRSWPNLWPCAPGDPCPRYLAEELRDRVRVWVPRRRSDPRAAAEGARQAGRLRLRDGVRGARRRGRGLAAATS